jgi:hypothetical protein
MENAAVEIKRIEIERMRIRLNEYATTLMFGKFVS